MASLLTSNKVVTLVSLLLLAGILLDGKVYNRPPQSSGIYTVSTYPKVKVSKGDQTILQFEHVDKRWHLTEPFVAPVHASRVQPLLDTNTQTLRSYELSELDTSQLFGDSVRLDIDSFEYQLGQLESVSKMRYILANNKVYLQADHVLPLLRAGQKAFVDLKVSDAVTGVEINDTKISEISAWSNLDALGLIKPEQINSQAVATINIDSRKSGNHRYQLHSVDGIAALVVESGRYGYLLSARQSENLGLTDYL